MKGNKKTKKNKEILKENKKPPVKEEPKNEPPKNEKQEKQEITEELEKKMYEGQEHIEEAPQDQNNEAPKKQTLIKPRETYLKEKISKMNCNENLLSNIRKELGDKIKKIIEEDNVLITDVPQDLKKYIKKKMIN